MNSHDNSILNHSYQNSMKVLLKKKSFLRKYSKSNTDEGLLLSTKEDNMENFILIKGAVNQEAITNLNTDILCTQICCCYFH